MSKLPTTRPSLATYLVDQRRAALRQAQTDPFAVPAAGVTRPDPGTIGAIFYDTTLAKPIWSDGLIWRDSAGVAV